MFEDMDEIEILTRMEKNYGPLSKKLIGEFKVDTLEKVEKELLDLLHKSKGEYNLKDPIPRVRMWLRDTKIEFLFFDRNTGKRVFLGEWLSKRKDYYEH